MESATVSLHATLHSSNAPVTLLNRRYVLGEFLNCGGFGIVYEGTECEFGNRVAIKLERNVEGRPSLLCEEAKKLKNIQRHPTQDGLPAIAHMQHFGTEGHIQVLAMKLLGRSVAYHFEKLHRLSLKTTLLIGIQVATRLEFIHRVGYLHRDLKPENFLLGAEGDHNRVLLIDFGLSARFVDNDGRHKEMQSGRTLIGTPRYASLRTHEGFNQSRRDDIEQLVYILILLNRGKLPWSNVQDQERSAMERSIALAKSQLSLETICANCPRSFLVLLQYARNMKFTEEPAYEKIRVLLKKELSEMNEKCDDVFDWDGVPKEENPVSLSLLKGTLCKLPGLPPSPAKVCMDLPSVSANEHLLPSIFSSSVGGLPEIRRADGELDTFHASSPA